ncbi:DUF1295 domain-containing protein [Elizabethkingia anophelis]|nr:DUF1295 domain-containing protein [Elizabethkingia anophelis]
MLNCQNLVFLHTYLLLKKLLSGILALYPTTLVQSGNRRNLTFNFIGNTSGRNTHEGQVADTLNQTGIYSTVRHPLYLGNFLMWLGPALLTGNMWFVMAFILFYWIYYERIMFAEEQFLERKFGEVYTKWAASVPAFIPDFSKFRRPEVSFSIKKVLKKEKNGLFALFLIFGVFDFIGEWLNNHAHFNILIIAGIVITMLMYVVLKFIKSKTSLLNESR